ncbi:MAG: DUF58 domain-containing protein [Acidimicrobiaceae bacterium]|nr:DUF58 domain-containing protein [Acidimicrobiaceae bacterium]MDE0606169.1 DUF58 domain-containing protein [Acidimicrobiaceae bacterium]
MPTRTGWWILLLSTVLGIFGRLVGGIEFLIPGAAGVAAVLLALLLRHLRPSQITVKKRLSPLRVRAGDSARVDVELHNHQSRRTPLLHVHDAVPGTCGFIADVAPIEAEGGVARASYRLNTTSRGLHEVGPVTIRDSDAFGLAERKHVIPSLLRLIAHPRIEPIGQIPVSSAEDTLLGKKRRQALGLSDEDFDGLRPYTPGDDLRRVHWLSSARQDELQVRQPRPPRHGLLSVVIDARPPGDAAAVLDVTTSVAGSIAASVLAAGDAALIETTDGRSTRRVIGSSQLDSLLDFLALLSGGSPQIHAAVPSSSGSVIAVSADPVLAGDRTARRNFVERLGARLVITTDAENWGADGGGRRSPGWIHLTAPNQLGALLRSDSRRSLEFA